MMIIQNKSLAKDVSIFTTNIAGEFGSDCAGETVVFSQTDFDYFKKNFMQIKSKKLNIKYFLSTFGCNADRIAIGINNEIHRLERLLMTDLGVAPIYLGEDISTPSVQIYKIKNLRPFKAKNFELTECIYEPFSVSMTIRKNGQVYKKNGIGLILCD